MADLFILGSPTQPRESSLPSDWQQRQDALDIQQSWIVEAPAGSGKTGLLMQRFLKLLADESVTQPEQVLGITFTIKATAELRERILAQLEAAAAETDPQSEFERQTRAFAVSVLERDRQLGWHLLEQPQRLRIRTIDSICAEIARSLPVLSGSGGQLAPVNESGALYREAARRTFLLLGGNDVPLNNALRTILLHRDGNLHECERLLAEMLQWRDQWGNLVPLSGEALSDESLDTLVLPRLERALDRAICTTLKELAQHLPADILEGLTLLAAEMGHAEGHEGEVSPIGICAGLHKAPEATAQHLDHWRALLHLLVTQGMEWRKGRGLVSRNLKFDFDKKRFGPALTSILDQLSHRDDLLRIIEQFHHLPPAHYPPEQWSVTKALLRVLRRALVELQFVFASRGECDFTELSLLARAALRNDVQGEDLATALGMRLQHLLVDEMQDTSTSQYELIELLTRGWDGHSQTVFLVGDPKQSIYLFRQARVERFLRTMLTGMLGELPIGRLQLTANFRSQASLVEQVNEDFSRLFPSRASISHPEDVPFVAASPTREATAAEGVVWHARIMEYGAPSTESTRVCIEQAQQIRSIVEAWRARPLPSGRSKPWSIGILVRNRNYLDQIVPVLKEDRGSGSISFRAVEIESLAERQEVLDLFALTRALLHPADRVAWLAILRAPWCGLSLRDLHQLTGADDPAYERHTIEELILERGASLSPDGCRHLERVWLVMQAASRLRGRLTTAQWAERAWRSLGGNVYLNAEQMANAYSYLDLLDQLEQETGSVDPSELHRRLEHLYAEPAIHPGAVDLITIHKAKGLEWDVVLVPGLERKPRGNRSRLLNWLELDSADPDSAHILLAPIPGKGENSHALNTWLRRIEADREANERKRLYYVACTRAREELHLFAAPSVSKNGTISPVYDSLLRAAWPAAEPHFTSAEQISFRSQPETTNPPLALAAGEEPHPYTTRLHRLPAEFDLTAHLASNTPLSFPIDEPGESTALFERPEGSFAARSLGNTVHALIDLLAQRIAAGHSADALRFELPQWTPRILALLRSDGHPPAKADALARQVRSALDNMLSDETGRWILLPHPGAASEQARTTWADRRSSVRFDRIFQAGDHPLSSGTDSLWIIDFKTTAHTTSGLEDFLRTEQTIYAPQIAAYAQTLSAGYTNENKIHAMLYYPLIPAMTWWEL